MFNICYKNTENFSAYKVSYLHNAHEFNMPIQNRKNCIAYLFTNLKLC